MNGLQLLTGALFAALIGCSAADAQPVPPGTCALAPSVCELQGKVFDNEKCNCVDANILIEIAKTGDGLHRWIRIAEPFGIGFLPMVAPRSRSWSSSGVRVEGALPAAEARMLRHWARFLKHTPKLLISCLGQRAALWTRRAGVGLKGLGPDYASAGAELAQNLAAVGAEREFVRESDRRIGTGAARACRSRKRLLLRCRRCNDAGGGYGLHRGRAADPHVAREAGWRGLAARTPAPVTEGSA